MGGRGREMRLNGNRGYGSRVWFVAVFSFSFAMGASAAPAAQATLGSGARCTRHLGHSPLYVADSKPQLLPSSRRAPVMERPPHIRCPP